jgi:hypothetical protein
MEEEMSWEAVAAFCMLGLTVLTSVVLTMRGLGKIELSLRNYFEQKHEAITVQLTNKIDASREMFGEAVKAARLHADLAHQKYESLLIRHQELELYIRDNYVEIDSFQIALSRLEKTIDAMDAKIDVLMTQR